MSIKKLSPTSSVPNPLHQFASYTYSWSLWKLHVKDFNRLMDSRGVEEAMAWNPGPQSFVLAEDGGRYPDRRQPDTLGLNYHIQDVQFETVVAPNKTSKSSNMISGSMTILEPYGVTLIESLIAASREGNQFNNYVDQPYMLQLEFRGYDDRGQEIPKSETVKYNKRFPIRFLEMKVSVTTRGAEYKITFVPTGQSALQSSQYRSTPIQFDITAGTVGEFFEKLEEKYQEFYRAQMLKVATDTIDAIKFKIDPTIAESKIVNEDKIPMTKLNPLAQKIDRKKSTFSIPRGTPIVDIISRVMAHSSYLIDLQLGLEQIELDTERGKSNDYIFNAFKTTSKITYGGVDVNGQAREPAINISVNRYPKTVTFNINQYSLWHVPRPETPPFTDSIPYTIKYYNYLYTGQNTDIIDLKIDFNTTYYTAILAHTNAKAATDSSADTDVAVKRYEGASAISLNTAIFTKIFPALAVVPNVTPVQYRFVADDVNLKAGMNIADREAAIKTADLLKSIYTAQNQEMLQLDLTIVGDPTLIKQDDWLYVPDPLGTGRYNDWSIDSYNFSRSYGHLPFDRSELVVNVRINSPVDMDLDIYNEGVAYPQPRYTQSLFSGQYKILTIKNKFSNGKFEQTLNLVRLLNSDYQTAFKQVTEGGRSTVGPVGTGIDNDLPLASTNEISAAGDEDIWNDTPVPTDDSIPPGTVLIVNPSSDAPWTIEVNGDPRE